MAIWQCCITKYWLAIWCYFIAIAQTEMIGLVAFIGLEGVNYVFSHVSLILVATFLF
jgi:hypothetical protein